MEDRVKERLIFAPDIIEDIKRLSKRNDLDELFGVPVIDDEYMPLGMYLVFFSDGTKQIGKQPILKISIA